MSSERERKAHREGRFFLVELNRLFFSLISIASMTSKIRTNVPTTTRSMSKDSPKEPILFLV